MDVSQLNLNGICRTCKCVTPQMLSVFETYENANQNPRIDEMLMACASIQVSNGDGLPSQICSMCVEQLKSAYSFKRQCETIDANLREHAKNLKVNEIKQELQNTEFIDSLNMMIPTTEPQVEGLPAQPESEPRVEYAAQTQSDFIQIMENNQMLLTCHECMKVFTTLEGLRGHKRVHLGPMYKCNHCDKRYTRMNHLHRHYATMHSQRKVHVCRICNKTLTRLEHLKRHLITHLKEKPFLCSTCNRGFNRIEHLTNHTPKCKGEYVHVCNVCNRAFNREDSLQVHQKLHDNSQPVLPTLDNLDNIEEHYYEIDIEANETTNVFSDNSDVEDCLDPPDDPIDNVPENLNETETEEGEIISTMDNSLEAEEPPNDLSMPSLEVEEGEIERGVEMKMEIGEDDFIPSNGDLEEPDMGNDGMDDNCSDSDMSEYIPQPKIKRGRGRPRKHPIGASPKTKGKKSRGRLQARRVKSDPLEEEEIGLFLCPICSEEFNKMSQLDRHARKIHKGLKVHKCADCGKDFSRANHLKRHMVTHSSDKPFKCEACHKSFSRNDHLAQHVKLHERQQSSPQFRCEVCQKDFNREVHLAKHNAIKHGIGDKLLVLKKFECPICFKNFTTEKYRDVHVKGHNGEKQYKCKTCQKSFLSKSHLTEHMKFHNDHSKKFLCSECGQRFIRNDYLVIHMRRHRGEKPFKCKYCGKGFPRTTDLTVHERYHTGEKTHLCTICGRGFGRAYNLTVHMRTHTGEKPYHCTYCDAAFAQGNDLKAHVRRHTGERFQCELCSESFLMGYMLTQHKRNAHGLNVVSNIRRLKPVNKMENPDEPPPLEIPLPKPVVPEAMFNSLHAQLQAAQFQFKAE